MLSSLLDIPHALCCLWIQISWMPVGRWAAFYNGMNASLFLVETLSSLALREVFAIFTAALHWLKSYLLIDKDILVLSPTHSCPTEELNIYDRNSCCYVLCAKLCTSHKYILSNIYCSDPQAIQFFLYDILIFLHINDASQIWRESRNESQSQTLWNSDSTLPLTQSFLISSYCWFFSLLGVFCSFLKHRCYIWYSPLIWYSLDLTDLLKILASRLAISHTSSFKILHWLLSSPPTSAH